MRDMPSRDLAHAPSTIRLGDLEVCRLGYGAMRLPGEEVWGDPPDRAQAIDVLRRAVELGVQLIDTAWYYGPFISNRLIREALHPYPRDLVIACKLGGKRNPDKSWGPALRPEELREGCEHDLRDLGLERIDVVHLRTSGWAPVPFLESLDAMIELKREGKIRHIALSNVSSAQLLQALERTPIVAVQNLFNVRGGSGALAKMTHAMVDDPEVVLATCESRGIAYLPFFPLAIGALGRAETPTVLVEIAHAHDATPAQIALAWLLARSKVMLPIPGTRSLAHLDENWAAGRIALSADDMARIATLGGT
jgi:aryl-alcohol dehydrogenase-like predicted oxidoreductase